MVDLMDTSFDLELVTRIVFDDRLGQVTIHFRRGSPPIITRSPRERALLWKLCSADVCGLLAKAFDQNGISFHEIHRGRSVNVEAKPAPAPERINLWNAVNDALYDFPKGNGVECADRVVGALERDKPTVLCVGNVLYFRQDKAIQDAKELRVAGCGVGGRKKCEAGESERGKTCSTCDGSGYVMVRIEIVKPTGGGAR